jgi:hypothetical protein
MRTYIDAAPFREIIEEALQWYTREELAAMTGISVRAFWRIVNAKQKTVDFDTADKLLLGLGIQHLWHADERFARLYEAA